MKTMILTVALTLTACASSTSVRLPDGTQGHVISRCIGLPACYKKASETCGGGKYEVVNQQSHVIGEGYSPEYTMTVKCK